MNLFCHGQIYTSVNTTSGIPSAWRRLVLHLYCNCIFLTIFHIVCYVKWKWCISVWMCSKLFSIYPYRCIHINTAKINTDLFSFRSFIYGKTFPVPSCSPWKISTFCFHRFWIILFNAVVMRKRNLAPFRVVEICCLRIFHISQIEFPITVKIDRSLIRRFPVITYVNRFRIWTHLCLWIGSYFHLFTCLHRQCHSLYREQCRKAGSPGTDIPFSCFHLFLQCFYSSL